MACNEFGSITRPYRRNQSAARTTEAKGEDCACVWLLGTSRDKTRTCVCVLTAVIGQTVQLAQSVHDLWSVQRIGMEGTGPSGVRIPVG